MSKARKIFVLGQTGAGKSSIANKLLKNDNAFKPAELGINESETEVVTSSKSHVTTSQGDLQLTIFDTPGLGDTKGRSITFLNVMMRRIKEEKPHVIIFFIPADMKYGPEIKFALKCFAQCLKPSADSTVGMPDGRVLLVVNKLPSDAAFGGDFAQGPSNKDATLARCMDDANECLTKGLGLSTKICNSHTFGFQQNKLDKDTLAAMWDAIRTVPDKGLDVRQFRTFAEVMAEATNLKNNAVSADTYAQTRMNTLRYDIEWHEDRMEVCKRGAVATWWIPFAGIATTITFGVIFQDSKSKVRVLRRALDDVQANKTQNLEEAKHKAIAWLKEVEDLKKMMAVPPR